MSRERQIRTALAHAAILTLAAEVCDELKGTSLYNQANKRKLNAVAEAILIEERKFVNNKFYDGGEVEQQFMVYQRIIESFKDALIEGPFESLPLLISGHKNFTAGKFIPDVEDEISDSVKDKVDDQIYKVIDSMKVSGCTENQIKGYLADLVDQNNGQEIKIK